MDIIAISSKKDKKKFIDFPHTLYEGDPNYVPELYIGMKEIMDEKKNPFFKHSKVQLFLAYRDNKIIGRIAAIRNNNHNNTYDKKIAFFGFFDCIEDYSVSEALLNTVSKWAKNEGLDGLIGPTNFSLNDTAGLLIEGFDSPPMVMMTYNKSYYPSYLDQYGFKKSKDLLAYYLSNEAVNPKALRIADMITERLKKRGITVRSAEKKNWDVEVANIRKVYNQAWEDNWGFVPMTTEEFDHLAEGLKLIVDTKYCIVAEENGKMIGYALAIPDINEIIKTIKKGRLFPTGIFKLLFNRKKIKNVRVITLGVVDGYRKMGIEALFYNRIITESRKNNMDGGEASWILEDNKAMNQALINMNAKAYKKYRLYEKSIS